MITNILKSKYVRLIILGIALFLAAFAVCIQTIGKDAWNTVDWEAYKEEFWYDYGYEKIHISGEYKVVRIDDIGYAIVDMDGNTLYESEGYISMFNKPGYIHNRLTMYYDSIYNFYTGEAEWMAVYGESVDDYWNGHWILYSIVNSSHYEGEEDKSFPMFYMMEDDYTIDKDSMLFTYLDGNESCLVGKRILGNTYETRSNLNGVSPKELQKETVIIKGEDVIYTCKEDFESVEYINDKVCLRFEDGTYRLISLAPETLGEVVGGDTK